MQKEPKDVVIHTEWERRFVGEPVEAVFMKWFFVSYQFAFKDIGMIQEWKERMNKALSVECNHGRLGGARQISTTSGGNAGIRFARTTYKKLFIECKTVPDMCHYILPVQNRLIDLLITLF